MAESGFAGASSATSAYTGASATFYGNFGCSALAPAVQETTESNVQLVHRGADCTLKNLRVQIQTNTRASNSTLTAYKNGSATSMIATITASTTGIFSDTTNTVALTDGDTFSHELVIGAASGNFTPGGMSANLESSSQSFNYISATSAGQSTTNASATRYWVIAGALAAASSTEANTEGYVSAAGTLAKFRVYVSAARATATTCKLRINNADSTQTVSITGTGAFEDTTHSDSVAIGDRINVATVTGTGTDTLTIKSVSVRHTPSTASESAVMAQNGAATLVSGATRYITPIGNLIAGSTEATTSTPAPFGGVVAKLGCTVSANASTTTVTVVFRKASADTAATFTIAGGATGAFADTSNTATISAADLVTVKASGSDGNVSFRSMSLRLSALNAYTMTVTTGAYTLTGNNAGLLYGRVMPVATGSYSLTGNGVSLLYGRVMSVLTGTYSLTGNSAGLLYARIMSVSTGSYVLTGNAVNLTLTQVTAPLTAGFLIQVPDDLRTGYVSR